MPLRGGMLLGIGSTVFQDKLQSYEYLRIEARPDGVLLRGASLGPERGRVQARSRSTTTEDKATIFTFANPDHDFPQRIIYRRGTEGWLYATIEGKLKGEERR